MIIRYRDFSFATVDFENISIDTKVNYRYIYNLYVYAATSTFDCVPQLV